MFWHFYLNVFFVCLDTIFDFSVIVCFCALSGRIKKEKNSTYSEMGSNAFLVKLIL
jgi:hypothetical protein